jgi:hypothetical protein
LARFFPVAFRLSFFPLSASTTEILRGEALRRTILTFSGFPSAPKTGSTFSCGHVLFAMPPATPIEIPEALAEAWRKLPPERRASLLEYAAFLAAQEQRLDAEDEKAWDDCLSDPAKAARFQEWGKQALAGPGDEHLDLRRL